MSSTPAEGGPTPIADRTKRAIVEDMVVDPHAAGTAPWEVVVYSGAERYVVDTTVPVCGCGDMIHRRPDGGCKHVRRWELTVGERAIPEWAVRDAADPVLFAQREYLEGWSA